MRNARAKALRNMVYGKNKTQRAHAKLYHASGRHTVIADNMRTLYQGLKGRSMGVLSTVYARKMSDQNARWSMRYIISSLLSQVRRLYVRGLRANVR